MMFQVISDSSPWGQAVSPPTRIRILAPIAQWTDFAADRNRHHFSARLLQGAHGSLLGGILNDDAVQLARVGSEPLLDLALRNLVRPHASSEPTTFISG